jgi:hypothetical protein
MLGVLNGVIVPYSARTLLGKPDRTHPRDALFQSEVVAECQARKEITAYIEKLTEEYEYEEAYGVIWPLEEYRRKGWAREMLFAFPQECEQFWSALSWLGSHWC